MDNFGVANRLLHEIESFDNSSGELAAWVKVMNLSSSEDTVLYMYYGNSGCDSQEYPEMVWDSDYCGIWHLDDFLDSTSNDNDGTNDGTDSCSGKIGIAKDFVEAKICGKLFTVEEKNVKKLVKKQCFTKVVLK